MADFSNLYLALCKYGQVMLYGVRKTRLRTKQSS